MTIDKPILKGRDQVKWPILIIGPISGITSSNFVHRYNMSSVSLGMTNYPI